MASTVISSLEIEVKTKADDAARKIDKLTLAMTSLRDVVNTAVSPLKEVSKALGNISEGASAVKGVSSAYKQAIKSVSKVTEETEKLAEATGEVREACEEMPLDLFTEPDVSGIHRMTMEEAKNVTQLDILKNQLLEVEHQMQTEIDAVDQNAYKIHSLAKRYRELTKELKQNENMWAYLGKSLKDSTAKIRTMYSSLKRIAMYRILRSVIKSIGEAINEGLTNAYQFSKIIGGDLADSLDRVASLSLQFKNQFGSAWGEIRIAIQPFVEWFLQAGIKLANTLAQIFAVFNGDTMYKKAKYMETAWADAEDAVKSYKSQTLGIDELNVISDSSSSNSDAKNYKDMFDYSVVSLNSGIKNAITKIKENFDDVLLSVVAIGTAIKAWSIGSKLAKALNEIGIVSKMAKWTMPIGLALSVTGLIFEANGAYNLGKSEQYQLKDILKTFIGGAVGIAGLGIAFGTTGLLIGIPVALTLGIVAYEMGLNKGAKVRFEQSEFKAQIDELKAKIEADNSIILDLKTNLSARQGAIDDIVADVTKAKALIDKIMYLDEKGNKTSAEIAELKGLVESVNAMGISGLQIDLDPDGKIVQTREELDKVVEDLLITKLQDTALSQMANSWYDVTVAQDKYYTTQARVEESNQQLQEANEELRQAKANYEELMNKAENLGDFIGTWLGIGDSAKDAKDKVKDATEKVQAAQEAVDEANETHKQATEILESLNKEYDYYKEIVSDATQVAKDILEPINNQSSAYSGLADSARDAADAIRELNSVQGGMTVGVQARANGGIIENFANGGFPHGQLFVANEGTSPEMIGSWGNQSAVANTDQIVNGIQNGVSVAVSNVLAPYLMQIANNTLKTANKNMSVNIGDREIARANNRGQRMLGATIMS